MACVFSCLAPTVAHLSDCLLLCYASLLCFQLILCTRCLQPISCSLVLCSKACMHAWTDRQSCSFDDFALSSGCVWCRYRPLLPRMAAAVHRAYLATPAACRRHSLCSCFGRACARCSNVPLHQMHAVVCAHGSVHAGGAAAVPTYQHPFDMLVMCTLSISCWRASRLTL